MTTFDDLPPEVRSVVMYLRARANYEKAYRNIRFWGVRYIAPGDRCVIKSEARANYENGYRNIRFCFVRYIAGDRCVIKSVTKKFVLKDICRKYGLHVSGTVNELLFRIRDHKRDVLKRACNNSERFWSPVL